MRQLCPETTQIMLERFEAVLALMGAGLDTRHHLTDQAEPYTGSPAAAIDDAISD